MEEIVCVSPNGQDASAGEGEAQTLFVACADGVLRLERKPKGSWEMAVHGLRGTHVGSLLYDRDSGGLFAGAHTGGFFASFDRGESWQRRTEGLTQAHVYTIAARQVGRETVLYVGTEPAHLFRSSDLGLHWQEIRSIRAVRGIEKWTFPVPPHSGHVKQIVFHRDHPATMLVCVEQGALLRTTDGGNTWTELDSFHAPARHRYYKDVHRIRIGSSNPKLMYMTGGDGLFRTEDSGETWTQLTDGSMRIAYPDDLHLRPGDDRYLFMAGAGSDPSTWPERQTADARIMCSRDGGTSWTQLRGGLPESMHGHIAALSMHVFEPSFQLFAGTSDGQIFAAHDEGNRWRLVAEGLPAVAKGNHHVRLPQRR